MKLNKGVKGLALGTGLAIGLVGAAWAGGYFQGLPIQTGPFTGNEVIPYDTGLPQGVSPQTALQTSSSFAASLRALNGSGGWRNALIGGDMGTNLWQRGTTASSDIANTLTYYADGWWNLGGASSAINVTKETGASDITTGYAASLRFQRKASNTDTAAICTGQVLTVANSTRFQGRLSEFSFWALAGANFSAANSYITATLGYGTGTQDSAANFAAGSWTGQVNSSKVIAISTTWTKYSVTASIPVGATQLGVKICYTPVGTAGTNDWIELTGLQLDDNPGAVAGVNMASFEHRPSAAEANLEYAYYYQLNETNGGVIAPGMITATNVERAVLALPVAMIATPTCTFTAGGLDWNIAGTAGGVGTLTQVSGSGPRLLTIGDTATATAGGTAFLVGTNTTGKIKCSAEL